MKTQEELCYYRIMINSLSMLFLGLNKLFSLITAVGLQHPAFKRCYGQKSDSVKIIPT